MRSRLSLPALVAAALVFASVPAAAQPPGSLAGTVDGWYGQPLAGVSIEVESVSGYRFAVESDAFGRYHFLALVPGPYSVTFTLSGHVPLSRTAVVRSGQPTLLPVRLEPLVVSAVDGRVVDETGLALPGVSVTLTRGSDPPERLVTGDAGRFRLEPAGRAAGRSRPPSAASIRRSPRSTSSTPRSPSSALSSSSTTVSPRASSSSAPGAPRAGRR